ncbi:ribonuclease Y [Candidatus Peregrinibacteria bacterium CG10_big_fil_rev_8_21_14_0_10_36_19]|nr:MAG: ribonuclease Y [Candidatus Peregrinibacteria bacterium CG10_big_fil_rev_8_21_14_0_10_36_19]
MLINLILALIGLGAGGAGGYYYRKQQIEGKNKDLVQKAEQILDDAKSKSKEILYEARNEAFKLQDDLKKEEQKKQKHLDEIEERLLEKEKSITKKDQDLEKTREELDSKVASVRKTKEEVEGMYKKQAEELERVAAMSKDEAKELLLSKVEEEARDDIVSQVKKYEKELKEKAKEKAKWMLADAMARCASETTAESTATIVNLPSDDMKGRIIGREGRNINAFEQVTGIDVIVDDTPGSIVISGFDLVRRYIAKVSLERLIEDGRIHPARIEETVEKVKEEVNVLIKELGEKAVLDTGVTGLPPNLIKLLGRLKFRVTSGQNALKQSMEVCYLAANLASELGADVTVCKRAALLHDIGKAVDHEIPGHHAKIGADIARKFGLSEEVVHAIESTHNDPEPESLEAQVVQVASMISCSRPGATNDNLDSYIRRLMELENLCNGFEGVKKSFVVQAGSEVRVFVDPDKVDDLTAIKLSHRIAKKIEGDLNHPGAVKVHVIREVREEAIAQ